jgi:hypothetical protein
VKIVTDDYNGRWRVIASTGEWTSVSWTKRGWQMAATEVVHRAWLFEMDFTGFGPPWDLEELEAVFVGDVAQA